MYIPAKNVVTTWKIPDECSVATAELFAIFRAVLYLKNQDIRDGVIFTDSKTSLQIIAEPRSWGDHYLGAWIAKTISHETTLQWVPRHVGIKGNEIADKATQLAHTADTTEDLQIPYNSL